MESAPVLLVMGVSGCGKSTIAELLASRIHGEFLDADDFHPLENRTKMAAGIPLTDADRWPWLETLNRTLTEKQTSGKPVILACSALRESYRLALAGGLHAFHVIFLKGSFERIQARIQARSGHFMPPSLLESQFAALEEPTNAIVVDVMASPDAIVEEILAALAERGVR